MRQEKDQLAAARGITYGLVLALAFWVAAALLGVGILRAVGVL